MGHTHEWCEHSDFWQDSFSFYVLRVSLNVNCSWAFRAESHNFHLVAFFFPSRWRKSDKAFHFSLWAHASMLWKIRDPLLLPQPQPNELLVFLIHFFLLVRLMKMLLKVILPALGEKFFSLESFSFSSLDSPTLIQLTFHFLIISLVECGRWQGIYHPVDPLDYPHFPFRH